MKSRIAVVILNYLNYEDTIVCVESILSMKYSLCGIVIVDNCSDNESYTILKKEYSSNKDIHVIKTDSNVGYARGNNYGINFSRLMLNAEFVFCCNNDVVFLEKDYFKKLLAKYESDVGVIGSKIITADNSIQQRNKIDLHIDNILKLYLNFYAYIKGTSFNLPIKTTDDSYFLHGCALLFTPAFFRYYEGFYKRTFLYLEEPILYLMCKEKSLRQEYAENTFIMHLEDKSSELSFGNNPLVINKHSFRSMKFLLYWSIRETIMMKM